MVSNIFYFVLNMSIIGATMIMVLLLIRGTVGKRIPKKFTYPLWAIVFFRLIIPVSLSSKWSIMNVIDTYRIKLVTIPRSHLETLSYTNTIQLADSYFPISYKTHFVSTFFNIAGMVWIIGMILMLLGAFVIYKMTTLRMKTAIRTKEHEKLCEGCMKQLNMMGKVAIFEAGFIQSPLVVGVIRPRIIVPKAISEDEMQYVLLHELSHIKRKDQLWKLMTILAVCIHWFNPLVWLFLYLFDCDMEMACDENVLQNIHHNQRKKYAMTLTQLASKQQFAFTAFGSTAVKARIMNIVHYKRLPLFMIIVTTLLCIIITMLLVTNPML